MNVLLAALELAPYVATHPSAEAIASLAKALRLLGHDVTICVPRMPGYEGAGLMVARQLSPIILENGRSALLYDTQLPSGVTLTLVDVEGITVESEVPPESQAALVGSFAEAVAALTARQDAAGTPFDVVHAHDAAAGLALIKLRAKLPALGHVPGRVLSIHDAARAGHFPAGSERELGLIEQTQEGQEFVAGDGLCLLKGLVSAVDAIVTPSDTYGRQLKAPEKFGALSRAFQAVQLHGISEGVEYSVYNPATDPALVSRYDAPDPANKARNKVKVLGDFGLDFEVGRPLVFCEVEPFGENSLDTLLAALPTLIRNDLNLIVAGPVEMKEKYAAALSSFPTLVAWVSGPSAQTRRRILAAADFYLSLSRSCPSGQKIMQAARYGAIPVAYRADAVTDVVVDADAELKTGTGIIFDAMTQRALVGALARATAAYRHGSFLAFLSRVMRQDLGWDRSARRHAQVYKAAALAHA
jgi:starch synthase